MSRSLTAPAPAELPERRVDRGWLDVMCFLSMLTERPELDVWAMDSGVSLFPARESNRGPRLEPSHYIVEEGLGRRKARETGSHGATEAWRQPLPNEAASPGS